MENNKAYRKDNIDLTTLFIKPLKYWRLIIIFSLILALLFGLYKFYPLYNKSKDINANQQFTKTYEITKDKFTEEITDLNNQYNETEEYYDNSIFLNLNRFDCYSGHLTYYISSDNENRNDILLDSYSNILNNNDLIKQISSVIGDKAKDIYITELIESYASSKSSTVSVIFSYNDKEKVNSVIDIINKYILSYHDKFSAEICDHLISLSNKSVNAGLDLTNSNTKIKMTDELNVIKAKIKEKNIQLGALQNQAVTKSIAIKSGIKYAFWGLILGLLVIYFILIFKYLFFNKIESGKQLKTAFNKKIFGEYPTNVKNNKFDNFLNRCVNPNMNLNEDEFIKVFWSNLNLFTEDKKILLIGENFEDIFDRLKNAKEANPDLTLSLTNTSISSSDRLSLLNENDAEILIVKNGKTSMDIILEEIELSNFYKKKFLGFIFI